MIVLIDSRVRRLYLPLCRLLRVIERMYRLDLSVYDVNPVKNVIDSIPRLHIEDSCNIVSLDDVLLQMNTSDHWENMREKSKHGCPTANFGMRGPSNVTSSAKEILDKSFVVKQSK